MDKKRKDKRLAEKIINALREPAPLNNNPGPREFNKFKWSSRKDRRNDGRVSPKIIKPGMKWDDIIKEALTPEVFWDDWLDYRDGQRNNKSWIPKEEVKYEEEKMDKQNKIRKARKKKCQPTLC